MVFALAVFALVLLALAPVAHGAPKRVVCTIGNASYGSRGGQFTFESGAIAVNHTGAGGVAPGSIYVAEYPNKRVQQLDPSRCGSSAEMFVRTWGMGVLTDDSNSFDICEDASKCQQGLTPPSPRHPGAMLRPVGIAIDQSTGDVYVIDFGFTRIEVFSATGQPQGAFGFGVLDGSPELQFCTVETGCEPAIVNAYGAGGSVWVGLAGSSLAVSPSGEIYVTGDHRLNVFKPTLSGATVNGVTFRRAFGRDVVLSGSDDSTVDERQRLTVRATNGSYWLRISVASSGYTDTAPIPFNAPATGPGSVQQALNEALAPKGASATVTGGPGDASGSAPYSITFGGAYGGDNVGVEAFCGGLSGGSPSSGCTLATIADGGAFEWCIAASGDVCKTGERATPPAAAGNVARIAFDPISGALYGLNFGQSADEQQKVNLSASEGTYRLSFEGQTTAPIPFAARANSAECPAPEPECVNVQAALEALSTIGPGNVLVEFAGLYVNFRRALAATDLEPLACDATGLAGGTCSVATERDGFLLPPQIRKFDSADAPLDQDFSATALLDAFGPNRQASQIAVDPDGGHLLITARGVETSGQIRVAELDTAGDLVELHGPDLPPTVEFGQVRGIAAAPVSEGGNLYLITHSLGTLVGAYVLGDVQPQITQPPPCATTTIMKGTVISAGEVVGYHFEYSIDGKSWTKVPVTDVSVGPSLGAIEVEQTATGLASSQLYHFRLLAMRNGNTAISDVVDCTTESAPSTPAAPPQLRPGSEIFPAPGNLKPRHRCRKGRHRVIRHGKARCVPRHRKVKRHRKKSRG